MPENAKFTDLVRDAKTRIRETTPEEVRRRQESGVRFHLVDVREDDEWRKDRAAGAVHVGKGVLERDIEGTTADRDAEIVVYCGGGSRSALAADILQKMGYRNTFSMAGGMKRWRELGLPIESGQ